MRHVVQLYIASQPGCTGCCCCWRASSADCNARLCCCCCCCCCLQLNFLQVVLNNLAAQTGVSNRINTAVLAVAGHSRCAARAAAAPAAAGDTFEIHLQQLLSCHFAVQTLQRQRRRCSCLYPKGVKALWVQVDLLLPQQLPCLTSYRCCCHHCRCCCCCCTAGVASLLHYSWLATT
jgi:hypothetical protein